MALPHNLSAKYKGSFAYDTVKDRMPVILTKVIDACYKQISHSQEKHGEEGAEDAKEVVGRLSKLRNRLMTDKPYVDLDDELPDRDKWNACLQERRLLEKPSSPSPFTSPWLFVECMMYREIAGILQKSKFMKSFDPFQSQKDLALNNAIPGLSIIAQYLAEFLDLQDWSEDKLQSYFTTFLKVSLWSNRFDLSLSAGQEHNHQSYDPVETLHELESKILVDHSAKVYQHLRSLKNTGEVRVDFVIDNAGFEFCSDLLLMEFLLRTKLVDFIHIHVKNMPWFVSDVTREDIQRTFAGLKYQEHLSPLCDNWRRGVEDGTIVVVESRYTEFWTLPHPFFEMEGKDADLYEYLKGSALIIFKGDLNYRKLVGDLNWECTTTFQDSLKGFGPAPICALRTLKADVALGLSPGQAEGAACTDSDWMVSGKYAVVQFLG